MDKLTFKEWSILSDLETIAPLGEDFEFSMARGELKTAKSAIERLMRHLKGEGDLEAWVQSKITKASEYLDTVADHMDGGEDDTEKKKEVEEAFKSYKSVEEIAKKHKVSEEDIEKQLEMGMKVEKEHTTDNQVAKEIALQHLDELPNYYSKLKKVEKVKEEWSAKYKRSIDCDNPKGFSQRAHCQGKKKKIDEKCWVGYKQLGMKKKGKKVVPNCVKEDSIDENKSGDSSLRDWFTKSRASDGTPGWVQLGGKYAGKPCAKQPGQTTKPKCGSSKMKAELSDKEEERAFRRKNQEDPNPDRKGKAKMVATEELDKRFDSMRSRGGRSAPPEERSVGGEMNRKNKDYWADTLGKNRDRGKGSKAKRKAAKLGEEKDACYSKVKSRYKVWPSAYASGALVKCRKVGAKNWGNKTQKEGYEFSNWRDEFKATEYEFIDIIKPDPIVTGTSRHQIQEMGEVLRYCPKCKKNETMKECRYGEQYWKMFSFPASLGGGGPYDPNEIHPANENVSFEIGGGHRQAQRTAKIRNLAKGTTNAGEKAAAMKKLSGPSLPLADSVIQPGQLRTEDYQRLQSTGNVYTILFSWRGRSMMSLQLFFPNMKRPSKDEVKKEIEKFYPGAVIMQWYPSPTDPSKPIVVIQGK